MLRPVTGPTYSPTGYGANYGASQQVSVPDEGVPWEGIAACGLSIGGAVVTEGALTPLAIGVCGIVFFGGCTSDRQAQSGAGIPDSGEAEEDAGTSQDSQTRPDTQTKPDTQLQYPCGSSDKDCDDFMDIALRGSGVTCTPYPEILAAGVPIEGNKVCDCDDANVKVFPGAVEECNGYDDDCDGRIDEPRIDYSGPLGTVGIGECAPEVWECMGSEYVKVQDEILPGREFCDELDNDCDGDSDEDCVVKECEPDEVKITYSGPDGTRNVGQCLPKIEECAEDLFVVTQDEILPQAELCDNIDNDCNGLVDDGDVCTPPLCEEGEEQTTYSGRQGTVGVGVCHPQVIRCVNGEYLTIQEEIRPTDESCNLLDDNCDGQTDEGVARVSYNGPAGTQNIGTCRPQVEECTDGRYVRTQEEVIPAPQEICADGLDNNCNGIIDDPDVCTPPECTDGQVRTSYSASPDTQGVGTCRPQVEECIGEEYVIIQTEITPRDETCNDQDDNCDGQKDEGLALTAYNGPNGTRNVGQCRPQIQECVEGQYVVATPEVLPQPEICNNLDDDCDGQTDNGIPVGEDCETGTGACKGFGNFVCGPNGLVICNAVALPASPEIPCNDIDEDCNGVAFQGTDNDGDGFKLEGGFCGPVDCDDSNVNVYPGANEACNEIDDDCDGTTDNSVGEEIRITNALGESSAPSIVKASVEETSFGIMFSDTRQNPQTPFCHPNCSYDTYFSLLTIEGGKAFGDALIADDSPYSNRRLIWTGNNFTLLQGLTFYSFDAAGQIFNGPRDVAEPTNGFILSPLVHRGNEYNFISYNYNEDNHSNGYSLYRLNENGVGIGNTLIDCVQTSGVDSYFSHIPIENGYIVLFNNDGWEDPSFNGSSRFFVFNMNNEGILTSQPKRIPLDIEPCFINTQSFIKTDIGFAITWTNSTVVNGRYCQPNQLEKGSYLTLLDTNGNKLRSDIKINTSPSCAGSSDGNNRLSWNGSELGVAFGQRDANSLCQIYFARFDHNGNRTQNNLQISHSNNAVYSPDFVWSDGTYSFVWSDNRHRGIDDHNSEIYFRQIGCFQNNPFPDQDSDGFIGGVAGNDCDDIDPLINPAALEACNYRDDNCDNQVDEGFNVGEECSTGVGACLSQGRTICAPNGLITICNAQELLASNEVCDGIDNDCDMEIDEPEILCSCDPDGDGIITDKFTDPNLLAAIREALGKGPDEDITREDALRTTNLDLIGKNIHDLSGLECFVNLKDLELESNQIVDTQPLAGLVNLTALFLGYNQISNLQPLSGLVNLRELYLYSNQISDLQPLAELLNLTYLGLYCNQVSDLTPIAGLTNLNVLDLDSNQVSDPTPIAGLVNLISLDLGNEYLCGRNQISDISPLAGLFNLSHLSLRMTQVSDLQPLAGLVNLETLSIDRTQVVDIRPLANLFNLNFLNLEGNPIFDFQPLAGLTKLTWLNLTYTHISDLQPLAGLVNLDWLWLYNNQIEDINPLLINPGLGNGDEVSLASNPLIPPAQIAALRAKGVTVSWP